MANVKLKHEWLEDDDILEEATFKGKKDSKLDINEGKNKQDPVI